MSIPWHHRIWPMTRADAHRLINGLETTSVEGIFAVLLDARQQVNTALSGVALPADTRAALETIFDSAFAEAHKLANKPGVQP